MGTASAKPAKLAAFTEAAATIRGELQTRIAELRASYDAFQTSGSSAVGNPDLMGVELPGLLSAYQADETFVSVVRQAFLDADAVLDADGRAVVDAAAFSAAFDAAATRAGYDPASLLADRQPVTVDVPIAAGTPRTSGFVNDPVCTATGHFLEAEEDLVWPDRLAPLRWRRTYSSRFVAAGPFGRGWASWAGTALLADPHDGTVAYHGPDGQMALFAPQGHPAPDAASRRSAEPGYRRVPGLEATLTAAPAAPATGPAADPAADGGSGASIHPGSVAGVGGWRLAWDWHSDRPGEVWTFAADGTLSEVRGPTIGAVSFDHVGGLMVAVRHQGGRRLDLDWDGARVVALRSSCGRSARYRYDDAGDLVAVDRAAGDRRYIVDDDGRIVEVWDADGVRLCRNTYDDEGRVVAQVSPFGRETTLTYHPGGRTVVADTDDGPVSVYEHDPVGRLVGLVDAEGHRMTRSFDAAGRCVEATGFDGGVTRTEVDEAGRTTARTTRDGVTERWRLDGQGRVSVHETDGGPSLTFAYDDDSPFPARIAGPEGWAMDMAVEDGLLVALTDADGVGARFEHDADGNVVAATNGVGATTRTVPHVSGEAAEVTLPDGATVAIERDDAGRMRTLRTATGDTFTVEWSPAGRLIALVEPGGARTSFEHGSHGVVSRIVDALGAAVELTHDQLERVVGLAAPGGAKWGLTYSALGLLSLVHDPAGGSWDLDHDAEGRLVGATDPLGHRTRNEYDAAGHLAAAVDPSGNVTRFTRDALGRVVQASAPDGGTTAFEWDAWGRPRRVELPDGGSVTYDYTPAGRVRRVRTAEGRGWTTDHDAAGRLVAVTDTAGGTTRFGWDVCDRLTSVTTPAGRTERYRHDAAGHVVETERDGRVWRATYDHAGRTTSLTDPAGGTTRYAYDPRGKLAAATDPLGATVRVRYDERGDATAVFDPLGGLVTTSYDAMRRPIATTDQLGRTTRLGRDAAGRVVRQELPTGEVVEWRRDPRGQVTDIRVAGRDAVVFDRDRAGRPVLIHEPARNRTFTLTWTRGGRLAALDVDGSTTTWQHDRDGRVLARRDPAGHTTAYSWDAVGRLASLTDEVGGRVTLDRDADGHLAALRGAGIERRWDLDAGGLVAGYSEDSQDRPDGAGDVPRAGGAGGRVTALRRDAAGRVVEATDAAGTTRYRYDAAGQLVGASGPAGAWVWHYDPAGRLAREDGPAGTTTYRHDEAHQLVRADGPDGTTTYAYDAAGRRTEESGPDGVRRYRWDARGDLTAVEDRGRRIEVDVDALGRLAAYGGTPLDWDPTDPVPPLTAVGGRRVVGPPGHPLALADPSAPAGRVTPLHADWRGSITAGGTTTDPWGARLAEPGAPGDSTARIGDDRAHDLGPGAFGELDLGELTWLRHRLYDPATRSFLAPDPLAGIPGLPTASNPYHYAGNDPLGFVDPLGLQPLSIDQYNDIRSRETGVQWGNIALAALTVGSFFIPGGPLIMTLVGAGMGMAPAVIQGVTTGEWDAGAMVKGALVGGISARLGFAAGGMTTRGMGVLSQTTARGAVARGATTGFGTGVVTEAYDVLPIPGADGSFDVENVAVSTVVGAGGGGLAHHLSPPRPALVNIAADIRTSGMHPAVRNQRTIAVGEDGSGALHAGSSNGFDAGQRAALQRHGVNRVPGSGALHAEEELLRGVPDLRRVGTSVRDPCGPTEHNCRQQLLDRGVEIENDMP